MPRDPANLSPAERLALAQRQREPLCPLSLLALTAEESQ